MAELPGGRIVSAGHDEKLRIWNLSDGCAAASQPRTCVCDNVRAYTQAFACVYLLAGMRMNVRPWDACMENVALGGTC